MRAADRGRAWVSRWWRGDEKGALAGAVSVGILPAEVLFRGIVALRSSAYDRQWLQVERGPIPVISVGNISAGGTGKTPFCAYLARRLRDEGNAPAVVLRGYGHDEVQVHRELNPDVPVHIAARRVEGVRAAAAAGASCAIVDDGFQHRALHRDVDIVLVSADAYRLEHRMLPRGPMREPVTALNRADLVLITRKAASREDADRLDAELRATGIGRPIGVVHLVSGGMQDLRTGERQGQLADLEGRRVVAVTSLADPGAFLALLRRKGARVDPLIFPDHHHFDAGDVKKIHTEAAGSPVVMTLKEAVKLRSVWPDSLQGLVVTQSVEVEEGETALAELLCRCAGAQS